ncbi:hypothetical protein LINPERHAP1_LOCUS7865 [Linum perenne]
MMKQWEIRLTRFPLDFLSTSCLRTGGVRLAVQLRVSSRARVWRSPGLLRTSSMVLVGTPSLLGRRLF